MRASIWIPTFAVAAAAALAVGLWPESESDAVAIEKGLEPGASALGTSSQRTPLPAEGTSPREALGAEPSASAGADAGPTAGGASEREPEAGSQAALRAENLRRRREQMERAAKARATRIADHLALGTGAELKILQVYMEEHDELTAIRAEYAAGERSREARARMRERADAVPKQREERLARLFGPETARAILEYEDAIGVKSTEFGQEPSEERPDQG